MPLPNNLPLAVTMGDAAGIGPEIVAKAWSQEPQLFANAFVIGDEQVMQNALAQWGQGVRLHRVTTLKDWQPAPMGVMAFMSGAVLTAPAAMGVLSAACGEAAAQCVRLAAQMALRHEIAALVTAPLNKEAMFMAGVPYPGHTELLAHEAALFVGQSNPLPVRMMLMNDELKVVLLSIHQSLASALQAVTVNNLLDTLHITHNALLPMLGRAPHITVAGLNPHAGENGLMGREEIETIIPALKMATAQGLCVTGPFPPDTVFMSARATRGQAGAPDVVLAMYHDQGLIPIKYMGVDTGVNVTLGLPLVRTSPDHGTAFDIAGQGIAQPDSLIAATRAARQIAGQVPTE